MTLKMDILVMAQSIYLRREGEVAACKLLPTLEQACGGRICQLPDVSSILSLSIHGEQPQLVPYFGFRRVVSWFKSLVIVVC